MKTILMLLSLIFSHSLVACSIECLPSGSCRYCHQEDGWQELPGHDKTTCKLEKHYFCTSLD